MVPALVMSALDIHNCLNLNLIFQDYILENTNCNSLILAVPQAQVAHIGESKTRYYAVKYDPK